MALKTNGCFIHGMKLKHANKNIQKGSMGPETQNKFGLNMNWVHVKFHAHLQVHKNLNEA